jgi:Protein of unknown function (DUF2585)
MLKMMRVFFLIMILCLVFSVTVSFLRWQGRAWIGPCTNTTGEVKLWAPDIHDECDNSQHVFDPYTITHLEHSIVFHWIFALVRYDGKTEKTNHHHGYGGCYCIMLVLFVAVMEAIWEMLENTEMIIRRYKATQISADYNGDAIINSVSDIVVASFVGAPVVALFASSPLRSLILLLALNLAMIQWIGDSMVLNVVRLVMAEAA